MSNEQAYFDALKAISREFQTPAQLRRNAELHYGLPYEEVLEMSYENMQAIAKQAIRGKRRPSSINEQES